MSKAACFHTSPAVVMCRQVGWPMMLPSKDRKQFAGKVHDLKKKHLNNMVMDGKLPLRLGEYICCKHVTVISYDQCDASPAHALQQSFPFTKILHTHV